MQSEPEDQNDFETAIGQLLVERGQLDRSALERALRVVEEEGRQAVLNVLTEYSDADAKRDAAK